MGTYNGKSVDEIISTCDKDGNGSIDYNEFKNSLLGWYIHIFLRLLLYFNHI